MSKSKYFKLVKQPIDFKDIKKGDLISMEGDEFIPAETVFMATKDSKEDKWESKPVGHIRPTEDSRSMSRPK